MARGTVRLGRRSWWECGVLYVVLLCWMYIGPTYGESRFLPPKLDINGSYIDIPANSTLRITCCGMYPLAWKLPPHGDNVSLRSSIYEEELEGLRPFKSVFELNTTDVMDLGRYTCYYSGTTDITDTGNSTSVYVFVNDDYYLFQPVKQRDQLVFVTVKHGELSIVPCLPSHSHAEVQLWKDLGKNEMELVDLAPHNVEFDPMRGFIIYNPYGYYDGDFICNGTVHGRVYNDSSMAVVVYYLPLVSTAPSVMIEKDSSFNPVLNDTFTLNCTVTGSPCLMYWDYPNKNSSRIETTKPTVSDTHVGQQGFGLEVMTSQLTVRDVQMSDEGLYTCYCKNYDEPKTYSHSVFVPVYAEPVVTVVNKTELFAPGVNYTLVCMVQGTAPMEAWWEWRECVEPQACDYVFPGGVYKRLGANSHHRNGAARGQLVRSVDGLRHRNVTLMLRAHQSGLYRCVASNSLGAGSGLARFYVTDAKNGFEIIASDVKPVDQDRVKLSCLASQFKYTNLTWRWKPKGSVRFVSLNASDTLDIKMSATAFSNNLSLLFNPIGRNQSGEYECSGYTRGTKQQLHVEFVNITVRGALI